MSNDGQTSFLLPQGISDPQARTGFFAAGSESMEAISLADGSLLWRAEASIRPLLVVGHQLAVQATPVPRKSNAIRIATLDVTRHGEPILASDSILLPEWVDALSLNPEVFQCRARLEDQQLVVVWAAHGRYSGGAPPPRQVLEQATSRASGTVRMDLQTGRIEVVAAPSVVPRATLREAETPPASPDVIWYSEPWQTGDRTATLVMKEESPGQTLYLKTWPEGPPQSNQEQVELARGTGITPTLSPDGKYVLLEPDEYEPGPRGPQRPWWIFDATTGQRLATVPHEEGAQEPCMVGPRLYYLVREPARPSPGAAVRTMLRARDLSSGALLWERLLGSPRTARAPELPRRTDRPD